MRKYIDAEKLIAEIKRLAKSYQDPTFITVRGNTANNFRDNLLSFITSLQQEKLEVDLDKEFKKWWDSVASGKVNVDHSMYWYMEKCAEHFYELGLNARKED